MKLNSWTCIFFSLNWIYFTFPHSYFYIYVIVSNSLDELQNNFFLLILIFLLLLKYVWETYYLEFVLVLRLKKNIFLHFALQMWEKLIIWTLKHIHMFSDLHTPFILLDKEKVNLYYMGLPFRLKWKYTIHIFMVNHRSTSLPECGPTEFPPNEPCFSFISSNL